MNRLAELHQTVLGKRQTTVVGDDQVIEHADVDQLQGFAQARCDDLVRLAGVPGCRWDVRFLRSSRGTSSG